MESNVHQSKKWAACMSNPFHYAPVILGSGTPTYITTVQRRYTFTLTNGCGAMSMVIGAIGNSPIAYAAPLASGTGMVPGLLGFTNAAAAIAGASSIRPIAAGLRGSVNLAATATPGQVGAGLYPLASATNWLNLFSPDDLMTAQSTDARRGDGHTILMSNWRPLDGADLEFSSLYLTSAILTTSSPYLVFVGFPNGTTVSIDLIGHYEATPSVPSTSALLSSLDASAYDIDQVLQYARECVANPVLWDNAAKGASFLSRLYTAYRSYTSFAQTLASRPPSSRICDAKGRDLPDPDDPGIDTPMPSTTTIPSGYMLVPTTRPTSVDRVTPG